MRALLIALQKTTPGPVTPEEQTRWAELGSPMRTARMEEEHALALARSMRDGGNFAPMLVCLEHSSLHARAVQLNLPVIPVSGASLRNPFNLWKLWRWQRRHTRLLVQTVGQDAMPLGRSVLRMRKPGATLLAHAFLLRPPTAQSVTGKPLLAAHKIFCGSQHIQERMPAFGVTERAATQKAVTENAAVESTAARPGDTPPTGDTTRPHGTPPGDTAPSRHLVSEDASTAALRAERGEKGRTLRLDGGVLTLIAPGMSLDDFAPSSPWQAQPLEQGQGRPLELAQAQPQDQEQEQAQARDPLSDVTLQPCGQRFIFALADAMTPRSGAQLVTRAMAAIWQRDDLPAWEIRALGSGPRYAELLEEAENLGVNSRLCLLNEQPLPEVLRHCHAWIAPGSSPEELPESLWAGVAAFLPTVCSKSPLHRERLSLDGNDPADMALLVEENDPQALAKAMIDIMQDAPLRRRLAGASQSLRDHVGLESFAARACGQYRQWCRQLGWLEQAPPATGDSRT